MKKILFIIICSILYPGNVYLSYDNSSSNKIGQGSNGGGPLIGTSYDFDESKITIGYNTNPFINKGIYSLSLGLSILTSPLIVPSTAMTPEDEINIASIYFLSTFEINNQLFIGVPIGYNYFDGKNTVSYNPGGTIWYLDEFKGTLTYGYGLTYKLNSKLSLSYGKIFNEAAYEGVPLSSADSNIKIERDSIYLGFYF